MKSVGSRQLAGDSVDGSGGHGEAVYSVGV